MFNNQHLAKWIELVKSLKNLYQQFLDLEIRKQMMTTINQVLRIYSSRTKPKYISFNAKQLVDKHNVVIRRHSHINKINRLIGERGAITIEHVNVVMEIVKKYLRNEIDENTALSLSCELALITKAENARLSAEKVDAHIRPDGWEPVYRKHHIDLLEY